MMAKETKVGLLAGLGFIICFAVILTNKGGPSRPWGRTTLADAGRSAIPAQPSRERATPNRASASRRQADPSVRTIPTGSSRAIPALHVPPQQIDPRSTPRRPNAGARNAERSQDHETARPEAAAAPNVDPAATRAQTPLTSVPGESDTSPRYMNRSMDRRVATPKLPVDRPDPTTKATKLPPALSAVHVVSAGETLSKIAARYYGKGTRANIDRLVAANPVELANPDVIKVGMQIQIPGVSASRESAAATPRAHLPVGTASEQRRAQGEPVARWYQIRKGDRYIDIARNELGDASRWEEIYELNVDKFPDPGNIREGVRIKLPARNAQVVRGGRP